MLYCKISVRYKSAFQQNYYTWCGGIHCKCLERIAIHTIYRMIHVGCNVCWQSNLFLDNESMFVMHFQTGHILYVREEPWGYKWWIIDQTVLFACSTDINSMNRLIKKFRRHQRFHNETTKILYSIYNIELKTKIDRSNHYSDFSNSRLRRRLGHGVSSLSTKAPTRSDLALRTHSTK